MPQKIDERERKLLSTASALPIGNDFLEYSLEETLRYGLSLGVRRLVVIAVNSETAPKDVIAATRLLSQISGLNVGGDEEEGVLSKESRSRITEELLGAVKNANKTTAG